MIKLKKTMLWLIIINIISLIELSAQEKLQVLTKKVQEDFASEKIKELVITGEKATIVLDTWKEPSISIEIRLISKNITSEGAKKDMEFLKYVLEKKGSAIYIRNYISLPANVRLESIVKAEIFIKSPSAINVSVANTFGKVVVKGLLGDLQLITRYTEQNIENFKGAIQLNDYFGDISIKNTNAKIEGAINFSKFESNNFQGRIVMQAQNAEVSLFETTFDENTSFQSQNTNYTLNGFLSSQYMYNLSTTYGDLQVPSSWPKVKQGKDKKWILFEKAGIQFKIKNYIGNILINQTK